MFERGGTVSEGRCFEAAASAMSVAGYPIKKGATTIVEAATSMNSSDTEVNFTMRLLDTICSFCKFYLTSF